MGGVYRVSRALRLRDDDDRVYIGFMERGLQGGLFCSEPWTCPLPCLGFRV